MDVAPLVAYLAPFLPYLLKAGESAAGEAGKKFTAAAWEKAHTLWGRLKPKVEAKPAAHEAAQDVAQNPADADALAALRLQMKKLLEADENLKKEIAALWQEAEAAGVTVVASGERAVAIGGSADRAVIVTGDGMSSRVSP
jgi:hypothetical protein